MSSRKTPPKDIVFGIVIISLSVGFLILAIIDPDSRPSFTDTAKVAIGAYIGLLLNKGGGG